MWQDVPPLERMGKSAVAFSVAAKPQTRRRRQMFVVVRPALLDGGLRWWRPGLTVAVAIGGDVNEGVLRITPGGQHKLLFSGKNPDVAVLRLPAFAWIKLPTFATADVEHEHHDDWLDLTLPEWARRIKKLGRPGGTRAA